MDMVGYRIVGAIPGRTRIRLAWKQRTGFLERLLGAPKFVQFTEMFEGTGKQWRIVSTRERAHQDHEAVLFQIEARMLTQSEEEGIQ
jgi:hypothetical protein